MMPVDTDRIALDLYAFERRVAEWRMQEWSPPMTLLLIELEGAVLRAEEQLARWRADLERGA